MFWLVAVGVLSPIVLRAVSYRNYRVTSKKNFYSCECATRFYIWQKIRALHCHFIKGIYPANAPSFYTYPLLLLGYPTLKPHKFGIISSKSRGR